MAPKRKPRRRRRNNNLHHQGTRPVVVYSDLSPQPENTDMSRNFKINELLTSSIDSQYSFQLENLTLSMMAPSIVNAGADWTAVSTVIAQAYGYMLQDGLLARIPMTSWRQLSTTQPTHFHFNRNHIKKHIYYGGFVPINTVNADAMFGVHALWSSGSAGTSADLKMKIKVTCRAMFSLSSDIQVTEITSDSSEFHMAVRMASLALKDKIKTE